MGALSPLFLIAAAAAAVPLVLHLFQRHQVRRVEFPALRYLARTEKEHARSIRLRQLLLMFLRVTSMLAIVGAGARLFLRGRSGAHPPTALAIVLDNSMSSGLVVGQARILDRLKELAERTLARATPDDRIWVIRVGEPWLPAEPGTPDQAREVLRNTEVSAARGDLTSALERALELVSTGTDALREIHLLSDLQESAFRNRASPLPAGDVPVVAWVPDTPRPANRALVSVILGGGLPPLQGRRTGVTVSVEGAENPDSTAIPVRLVVSGKIRGAATVPSGSSVTLPLTVGSAGWVRGYAEIDADALRTDDRRYFAVPVRPPPRVAVTGEASLFLRQAVAVLENGRRVQPGDGGTADVLITTGGEGLGRRPARSGALILPPSDADLLPALNRRLAAAGIPFRYGPTPGGGEAALRPEGLPEALAGVTVTRWYSLISVDAPPAPPVTVARLADGEPWIVAGNTPGGRYLLLGSPLDAESSTLPVSAAMVPFLGWALDRIAGFAGRGADVQAGDPVEAPRAADAIRMPSGREMPIGRSRRFLATSTTGTYTLLAGDSILSYVAVNPPVAESRLARLSRDALARSVPGQLVPVLSADRWEGEIFRTRRGPELWWPLLIAALGLLAVESLVAAAGPSRRRDPTTSGAEDRVTT